MSSRSPTLAERLAIKGRRLSEDGRFSYEEVQLALRNRGTPIEALRYEITPSGLHYLLTHFDMPDIDEGSWRLEIDGLVERPLSLRIEDLKRMTEVTEPVTMECSGSGRAMVQPRPVGQPWNLDAVSTARWTGARLREVLARRPLPGHHPCAHRQLDTWGIVSQLGRSCDGAEPPRHRGWLT